MVCKKCGDAKPATLEFFFKNTHCNALRQPCKTCWPKQHAATNRVWRLANRDRCRDWALQRLGDFTLADYNKLKKIQGGVCAICGVTPILDERLRVDHDHSCCPAKSRSCGKCVRGLLCSLCNLMIGYANDDTERLRRAIEYLEKSRNASAPVRMQDERAAA